jgi:hypothetical protein
VRQEDDFEFLCESLVWISLFRDLGIHPIVTADASVQFEHLLDLIKLMRPYRSLESRGYDSFRLQVYFITHLTFVLSQWGAFPLRSVVMHTFALCFRLQVYSRV